MSTADIPDWTKAKYVSLRTTKRNGQNVDTAVWFALDGTELVVYSEAEAGKIKRIRQTPAVSVAPCTMSGKVVGPWLSGAARLLAGEEARKADRLLLRRYGLRKRAIDLQVILRAKIRRRPVPVDAYISIALAGPTR